MRDRQRPHFGSGRVVKRAALALALTLFAAPLTGSAAPAFATAPHAGTTHSQLHAITCVKSTSCFAVGEYQPAAGQSRPLIERWNGTTWSIVTSPNPAGASFSRLYAVSCISAANCFAVGQQSSASVPNGRTLIERWNGKAWSIVVSANPAIGGQLNGVSCTSASFCVAVGLQSLTTSTCCKTFVERWNGLAWTGGSSTPVPAKSAYSRLAAVSCTSALKCFAVGTSSINGTSFTLVERWNGTAWATVASPNPRIGTGGYFNAVSCTSATSCVAAGAYNEGGVGRPATLIEKWNGTTWAIVANAIPPRAYTELNGVACANASTCFTVGDWNRLSGAHTLIQRWNGKAWSLSTSPAAAVKNNSLAGVACSSPTGCFAVGTASTDGNPFGGTVLVAHWNGSAWSAVTAPSK